MPTMHHVNLCVPEGGADAEADWLVNVLGYRKGDPGPDAAKFGTLRWYEAEDGHQVPFWRQKAHTVDNSNRVGFLTPERAFRARGTSVLFWRQKTQGPALSDAKTIGNLWEFIGPPE